MLWSKLWLQIPFKTLATAFEINNLLWPILYVNAVRSKFLPVVGVKIIEHATLVAYKSSVTAVVHAIKHILSLLVSYFTMIICVINSSFTIVERLLDRTFWSWFCVDVYCRILCPPKRSNTCPCPCLLCRMRILTDFHIAQHTDVQKLKKIMSALPQKHVSWVDAVKQSFCGSSSSSMSGSSGSSRLVVVVVAQSFNNKQW